MDDNKQKALTAALGQIERQFGKGAVMRLGDPGSVRDVEAVSTGSLNLDIALGVGGLPRGRVIEIFGPESSGKTTIALQTVAQMQRIGGTAAFVDAEHALDPAYAEKLGINIADLLPPAEDAVVGGDLYDCYHSRSHTRFLIGDVRGKGLMIGTEFTANGNRAKEKQLVKDVIHSAEEKGMLLLSCGTYDNTVRWIPPLNITSEQINDGLKIFSDALQATIT